MGSAKKIDYKRHDIAIWQKGRTRIWAPIKIASVTGFLPTDYNSRRFVSDAQSYIKRGLKLFKISDTTLIRPSDRGFYLDFYPWLSQDGTLFLSLSLFSQFHCKKSVFEKKKMPLTGPYKKRKKLFIQAASIMEKAVFNQMKNEENGDGFDIVSQDVPVVTWGNLGFPLPKSPEKKINIMAINAALPQHWRLKLPTPDDPPLLQFQFPSPLDQYRGEAKHVNCEIHFTPDLIPENAKGNMTVHMDSVTMGESDLDATLQTSLFFSTKKYPVSQFTVTGVQGDSQPLSYGHLSMATVSGTFLLKGKNIPLTAAIEIEPVIDDSGKSLLLLNATFQIDLKTFNIQEADGPEPQRHTVVVDLNLSLEPI